MGTHLVERDADEEDAERGVEVVLDGAAQDGQKRDLDEVNERAERDLEEVKNEDGDAPLFVRVVEVLTAHLVDGADAEGKARDDDWQSLKRKSSVVTPFDTRSALNSPRTHWMIQCGLNQNGLNVRRYLAIIAPAGRRPRKPMTIRMPWAMMYFS